jgi:glycosyltransferase involved in cell wall biosynthesis
MTVAVPTRALAEPHGTAAPIGQPLPRVLYAVALDGSQKFGSLEEQMFVLAKAFQTEGSLLLPLFVAAENSARTALKAFEEAGLPTAELDLWSFSWSKLRELSRLIADHRIQLMHWNFYAPVNPYLVGLSILRPKLRHYITDHNSRPVPFAVPAFSLGRLIKAFVLKQYRQVWCVSQFVNDCLARDGCWSNLKTCLHFINTDRFRPDPAVRETVRRENGGTARFIILAVANLIPEKGLDVAIRALAQTPSDTVLWIVGQGAALESLQKLTADLGVRDRVRFFGQQAQVQPFMQAADCLVCPSLWAEAAGLVNLEALSTALPVLASRIGGIPEYVDDRRTGLLFPPGDHAALASLIRTLHNDPDECRRLGQRARETAGRRFSIAANLTYYLELYRKYECPS